MRILSGIFLSIALALTARAAKTLELYFIDVEGGQATLIVGPSGESMLVDTGWPGYGARDALRIAAAAKKAHVKKLDYVFITHFHRDHVGGVQGVAERLTVGTYLDHGPNIESDKGAKELNALYEKALQGAKHTVVKAGDKVPMKGVDIRVVESNGDPIATPLAGAGKPNAACAGVPRKEDDPSENARSAGFILSYGSFRFADLGDLTWNKELALACPNDLLGPVSLYLTTHHGLDASNAPPLVAALHPKVAIMNNGARKGGSPEAWKTIRSVPGLEDLWQLHFAVAGGKETNSPDTFLANIDDACEGKWIHVSVQPSGEFTVTNSRNNFSKSYR